MAVPPTPIGGNPDGVLGSPSTHQSGGSVETLTPYRWLSRPEASACGFLSASAPERTSMAKDMAIDCHQRRRFVLACDPEGNELWHRRFATTAAGEADLLRQVEAGDRVVLEATTGAFRLAKRL